MTEATHYTLQIWRDTDDRDGSSWGLEDSETDANGGLLVTTDLDGAVQMARFVLGADYDGEIREPREGWLPVIGVLAHDYDPDIADDAWEALVDPQSWSEGYVTLDGVHHTHTATEDSADLWNEMGAFIAADRPDASVWLAMREPVMAYGDTLARLVLADYNADPDRTSAFGERRLADVRSWEELHGVCDANDYLQLADEAHGRELGEPSADEYNRFCNAAVGYAEGVLFKGGAKRRLGA